ncbi:zinc finger CCCH domain-containing protein 6-like isoform X2 [Clupea harengus]|uniref:Zinc finger CCCH domain-containing protein 6-like isoform X2 n=1 Tax=Clupea harengus TaxID=7950 RepID=A0A8M1KBM9_CLUHA|nr:zinc finger CCCH domain-containing protein 6-like isoform X2 [Clupea harengus]
MRECERVNKREHFAKNNTHRANIKYVHKRQGQDTNRGKGCVLEDKRRTNSRRGAFNQRHEAGSKRGRDKWQTRHMPKQEERKPFMTEEFKELNSIAVNGRLICKHFLWERCLKGDECQFEHSRDLGSFKLNEVCKFYVQGFCLKGDHCLYMHRTFPCKFFHTGNTCYHDNNCKFSHDPLTDLTKRLLDKYLEEQKVDTGTLESETQELEPEPAVDFLTNPVKLSFYSTAPVPEPQPPRPFGFGANDAEFSSEHPSSTLQPTPSPVHTDTAASTGADPTPDAHTPHTATPPTTLPSQTDPVKWVIHTHTHTHEHHTSNFNFEVLFPTGEHYYCYY